MRNYTERWETVIAGGNILVGLQPELVKSYVKAIRETELGERMRNTRNPYGNGNASKMILKRLKGIIR